ncbi:DUF3085 domain-containing protein [Micromonospora sp. 4G57]|uniref:DUF3085 domain-containing protein n=1 Tax=Micromonospora sicca TaxID=2202420 RepID=A0ABU5JNJ0_9ACTN|nr:MULTISPECIES: DUF3085 domain-containing protein [unclassified Micromonospora]MDZ5447257.1 DUF3085 domain-containing protein [Micromonospora sp. 4G57]MDZ5493953.1 DUF3085 domain-containing protein [Micromonospora sp. 4G53]
MALHLYFDLAQTLRLAEHAVARDEHAPSFTEHDDGIACPGALVWVHDHGVYLMSSGLPGLGDPDRPGSSVVVYADGWNPDTDGHRRDTDLGGDDFAEHLHLTEQPTPLIGVLRAAHTRGYPWLHLSVTGDTYEVRVARTRRHLP